MTRQKIVPRQFYTNYVKKAEQFYGDMEDSFQKQRWDACVSHAVHTVISIVDAIAVQKLGKRSSSGNHIETILFLDEVKTTDENKKSNLKNDIMDLIDLKTPAEYEEKLMSKGDAEKAMHKCKKVYSFILEEIKKAKV